MSLHVQTPLLEAPLLSARLGSRVFLKLECVQPSGSFKVRGVGFLCRRAVEHGATAFITSSGKARTLEREHGGNAAERDMRDRG